MQAGPRRQTAGPHLLSLGTASTGENVAATVAYVRPPEEEERRRKGRRTIRSCALKTNRCSRLHIDRDHAASVPTEKTETARRNGSPFSPHRTAPWWAATPGADAIGAARSAPGRTTSKHHGIKRGRGRSSYPPTVNSIDGRSPDPSRSLRWSNQWMILGVFVFFPPLFPFRTRGFL